MIVSKTQARHAAVLICKALDESFKPKVWYSLYWQSCATNGTVDVYREGKPEAPVYTAYYPAKHIVTGRGATPESAVNDLVYRFYLHVKPLNAAYNDLITSLRSSTNVPLQPPA